VVILSEIVELKRGKRLVKSQLSDVGKYAVYQNSMTPLGYYHQSNTSTDTTYIICAGAAGEIDLAHRHCGLLMMFTILFHLKN
jgi:type I restriction enzyme S subunit